MKYLCSLSNLDTQERHTLGVAVRHSVIACVCYLEGETRSKGFGSASCRKVADCEVLSSEA